jgi:GT2 family glycosyltransferase
MPTFGNLRYTEVAWAALEREIPGLATGQVPALVVVGDPTDTATRAWAKDKGIPHVCHDENWGLPVALNDILDAYQATQETAPAPDQPWLLLAGNDVLVLPGAIAALQAAAEAGGYDHVVGRQETSWDLVRRRPALRRWFHGEHLRLAVGWANLQELEPPEPSSGRHTALDSTGELHNLYLASPQAAMALGYWDPNFYPAYFEDNDMVQRARVKGLKLGMALDAWYLHFLSRVRFEAVGVDVTDRHFQLNAEYYRRKWGGPPGGELHRRPFAGAAFEFGDGRVLGTGAFAGERLDPETERQAVEYWRWTPRAFHNRHRGQTCVIAGNGPSLAGVDVDRLQTTTVFGLNRGYLMTGLPITYHVAVNPLVLKQWGWELAELQAEAKFWPIDRLPDTTRLWHPGNVYGLRLTPQPGWQPDAERPMWEGHTVAFVALQLAFYMGFRRAVLIGFDHEPAPGDPEPDAVLHVPAKAAGDGWHFTPAYFPPGSRWQAPNLPQSTAAFMLARDAWAADGRQVINATPGGGLDVFERQPLAEALR